MKNGNEKQGTEAEREGHASSERESRVFSPVAKLETVMATMLEQGNAKHPLWKVWRIGFSITEAVRVQTQYPIYLDRAQLLFESARDQIQSYPRAHKELHLAWVPAIEATVSWERMHLPWEGFAASVGKEAVRFSLKNASYAVQELPTVSLPSIEKSLELRREVDDLITRLHQLETTPAARKYLTASLRGLLEALEWEEILGPEYIQELIQRGVADVLLVGNSVIPRASARDTRESPGIAYVHQALTVLKGAYIAYSVAHDLLEAGDSWDRFKALIPG